MEKRDTIEFGPGTLELVSPDGRMTFSAEVERFTFSPVPRRPGETPAFDFEGRLDEASFSLAVKVPLTWVVYWNSLGEAIPEGPDLKREALDTFNIGSVMLIPGTGFNL